jgi:site-specific DNA recombinase
MSRPSRRARRLARALVAITKELMCLVRQIVERVTVAIEGIELRLDRGKVAVALTAEGNNQRADTDPILLLIEARLRRAGKGKRLAIRHGAAAQVNESLIELIKEAFAIRNQLPNANHVQKRR